MGFGRWGDFEHGRVVMKGSKWGLWCCVAEDGRREWVLYLSGSVGLGWYWDDARDERVWCDGVEGFE